MHKLRQDKKHVRYQGQFDVQVNLAMGIKQKFVTKIMFMFNYCDDIWLKSLEASAKEMTKST
jgi:hypothetical protein